jgi:diacylglycerol kinase (ATP)
MSGSIFDLGRVGRAFGYSLAGFRAAWRQTAFRQEVVLAAILVPLGIWLGRTGAERALLAGSVLLVPLVELLNSAVEMAIDRIGPERHELSGRAKDLGSAAVVIAIVITAVTWALVLWP